MVTIGVVVAACGGAMKGQWEERALGKRKKKKNEEGEETAKNGLERDVTWWDKSYRWVPFFA